MNNNRFAASSGLTFSQTSAIFGKLCKILLMTFIEVVMQIVAQSCLFAEELRDLGTSKGE